MSLLNDTRFGQIRALVDDARRILHEIQEEGGHSPVDARQLQQIRDNLNYALIAADYFTVASRTRWS